MQRKSYLNSAIHIACWLVFVQLMFDAVGVLDSLISLLLGNRFLDEALLILPLSIFFFYWNSEYLIPKFLRRKSWWRYLILLFASLLSLVFIGAVLYLFFDAVGYLYSLDLIDFIDNLSAIELLVIGASTSYAVARINFKNDRKRQQILNEQLKAEIKLLKAQADPHFLFNSLNTIFSIAQEEEAHRTGDAMLKLSEMMRYHIREAEEQWVPLRNEIRFIENYVELQRLRLAGASPINYSVTGEVNDQLVLPLVIIPFIENAFKYGISYTAPHSIDIALVVNENTVQLKLCNRDFSSEKESFSTHVGLNNIQKRLELHYQKKFSLNIINDKKLYQTELILPLS